MVLVVTLGPLDHGNEAGEEAPQFGHCRRRDTTSWPRFTKTTPPIPTRRSPLRPLIPRWRPILQSPLPGVILPSNTLPDSQGRMRFANGGVALVTKQRPLARRWAMPNFLWPTATAVPTSSFRLTGVATILTTCRGSARYDGRCHDTITAANLSTHDEYRTTN